MSYVDEILERVIAQNPAQPEFHQAVKEVLESLRVVIEADEDIIDYYKNAGYTITDTGEIDEEEGTPIYIFSNASTRIVYSCSRGVATRA